MRKTFVLAVALFMLAACEKAVYEDTASVKRVTFSVIGDFGSPTFTRAMSANGSEMKELWAFDFVDGVMVDYIHQTADDPDFGSPSLTLSNGSHTICFVVSRGDGYMIDESANVLEWEKPSDTFWKSISVNISPTSAANVSVTLDRVATKLRIAVTDEIPDNVAQMVVTPAAWYYGLDYLTGKAAAMKSNSPRKVDVPSSLLGTTGQLAVNIFGMSDATEWTTDVNVTANDGSGVEIASVTISGAPFISNRQTGYSGRLFSNGGSFSLSLNDAWGNEYSGTW